MEIFTSTETIGTIKSEGKLPLSPCGISKVPPPSTLGALSV